MYISNVRRIDECMHEATLDLRKLGIKCRPKKPKQQTTKNGCKVFKVPLGLLPTQTVTLKTGQQIPVPKLVHELCSFILTKADTEGIFRKQGSRSRQNEIKVLLNAGGHLEEDHHVIDVAAVLKTFLRELPEPLIPFGYHELFLRSILLDGGKLDAVLLACLLLPLEYLNTLSYLLQFLYQVAENSRFNKMDSYNLAVVMGPNVFPIEEKLSPNVKLRTTKTCELFQLLIENASSVGVIPDHIIERIGASSNAVPESEKKKKKRRSGSLTRMFNGLKKMVGGKSVEETHHVVTPDLLMTPINHSIKKRRFQDNSTNKKRDGLGKLALTPFPACNTPVSMDQCGNHKNPVEIVKEKKSQWFLRSKSVKNLCKDVETEKKVFKNALERRWSAIGQTTNLKRMKKRNSCAASLPQHKPIEPLKTQKENTPEPDYIRVPKFEYEAIKNRVSAMERRISIELDNVHTQMDTENDNNVNSETDKNVKTVQTVYEQTLSQAENLSTTTDQLAKRLSRELKIRRSADQKIIRSPSARKIGSMRRRSRELEKSNNSKLMRHQSWHVAPRGTIPRVSLRRGKPNTLLTGLPTSASKPNDPPHIPKPPPNESSSVSCNLSGSSCDTWISADGFFATLKSTNSNFNDRSSLAKLRSQNAGMVLAKAKLFDQLKDSDSSGSGHAPRSLPRARLGTKMGAARNHDARLSYRIRTLRYEDKNKVKKSISPRRRTQLSQRQKLHMARHYMDSSGEMRGSDKENKLDSFNSDKNSSVPLKDCNRNGAGALSPGFRTPRATPQIKRSLNVRTPKRVCRTPGGLERGTPLKVLETPGEHL